MHFVEMLSIKGFKVSHPLCM